MEGVKIKSFSILQEKRRKEMLDRNRQRRDEMIAFMEFAASNVTGKSVVGCG